jgi:hypothetical protein
MSSMEIVKHEGLDGAIWYVVFRLTAGSRKRECEVLRTTDIQRVIRCVVEW